MPRFCFGLEFREIIKFLSIPLLYLYKECNIKSKFQAKYYASRTQQ